MTDTTPNDGSLDDDIDTIQLVGTEPPHDVRHRHRRSPSNRVARPTATVLFNRLIASTASSRSSSTGSPHADVTPTPRPRTAEHRASSSTAASGPCGSTTSIGARSTRRRPTTTRISIVIGDPTTPLDGQAVDLARLDLQHGLRQHRDRSPTGPLTTPSVDFIVNGAMQNFNVVSITQSAIRPTTWRPSARTLRSGPACRSRARSRLRYQFLHVVGTTGRTSVQATAIDNLNVAGTATNFTASRGTTPFQTEPERPELHPAGDVRRQRRRGGPGRQRADRQAHVQQGPGQPDRRVHRRRRSPTDRDIDRLRSYPATTTASRSDPTGYPAAGLLGGLVAAKRIGKRRRSARPITSSRRPRTRTSSSSADRDADLRHGQPGHGAHQRRRSRPTGRSARSTSPATSSTARSRRASTTRRTSPGLEGDPQRQPDRPDSASAATWSTASISATFIPRRTPRPVRLRLRHRDGRARLDHRARSPGGRHAIYAARTPARDPGRRTTRRRTLGQHRRRASSPARRAATCRREPSGSAELLDRRRRAGCRVRAVLARRAARARVRRPDAAGLTTARGRCPSSGPRRSRR